MVFDQETADRADPLISVTIKTILHLKKIFGDQTVIDLPAGATLSELLSIMADRWGDEFATNILQPGKSTTLPHIRLLINGRDIAFLNRFETRLNDEDEVMILPPVAGG
jgi:molybdopterin converting factor small subunit